MTEQRRRGRKRIHPVDRVRHNVNIERDETFDANLAVIMSSAGINQTDAIKTAVSRLANQINDLSEAQHANT